VVVLVVAGYLAPRASEVGVTSEMALLVTFSLGALARHRPALAVAVAVGMTVLLVSKEGLHRFVRQTVSDVERTDALKFFVAAFVVLPLLPARRIGPYGVLEPRRIWLLVVLVTGIGWLGYAATRALGARRGLLVTGFAGGFVSGAATTGAMAAKAREAAVRRPAYAAALLASVATLVQLAVVTAVVAPEVTVRLAPALVACAILLTAEAVWLALRHPAPTAEQPEERPQGRPFSLLPALALAAVLTGVLLVARWLSDVYGDAGAALATAVGGLADVHAGALAVSSLARDGALSVHAAVVAVAAGLGTNTVTKLVLAAAAGGVRVGAALLGLLLPPAVAFAAALVVS
jgi:uncharacterized membrane protein (DUF4010 family)